MTRDLHRLQHASRLREGPDGQRDQGGGTLPRSAAARRLSPETTARYEGFVHPYQMEASVDRTRVNVLIRDFVTAAAREERSAGRADRARGGGVGAPGRVARDQDRRVLSQHAGSPRPASRRRRARAEAIRRAGLEPIERPIRGGTDGSRLSFMGLPTPNLFAGEHNFHSRLEWVSVRTWRRLSK